VRCKIEALGDVPSRGDVIQSSYLNFERYGEKLCRFEHSMEMPMSANEAKSSGPALRELAGLLPDLGEFYRDVHSFSIPHYKQVSNRWSSRRARLPG
jgi:hypothetical protein